MLRNLSSDDLKLYGLYVFIASGVLAIVGFITPFFGDPYWGPSHPSDYVLHALPRSPRLLSLPRHYIYIQPWADDLSNVAIIGALVGLVLSFCALILYGRARRREEIG